MTMLRSLRFRSRSSLSQDASYVPAGCIDCLLCCHLLRARGFARMMVRARVRFVLRQMKTKSTVAANDSVSCGSGCGHNALLEMITQMDVRADAGAHI